MCHFSVSNPVLIFIVFYFEKCFSLCIVWCFASCPRLLSRSSSPVSRYLVKTNLMVLLEETSGQSQHDQSSGDPEASSYRCWENKCHFSGGVNVFL